MEATSSPGGRTAGGAPLRSAPDRLESPDARAATLLIPIDPPWDQRLARVLARPLSATPITPSQITTLSLAMGLLAALLYAQDGWALHLGAACFVLSFWLDHVDGELVRMTGRTSFFGHYYDLAAGGAVLVALFVGIGIGARRGALGAWSIGLGASAGLATAVIFVLRMGWSAGPARLHPGSPTCSASSSRM